MQDRLIVLLKANDLLHPDWAVLSSNSQTHSNVESGDPSLLAKLAIDKEVWVFVPAEEILLTTVTLPKMSDSRFLQALPYALEDQLIGELDTLHFAKGDYLPNNQRPVAVVSQDKMQQWLHLLRSWAVEPDVLTSMVFCLPDQEQAWQLFANDELAMVRTGRFLGFGCDRQNLPVLLETALHTYGSPVNGLTIYHPANHAIDLPLNFTPIHDRICSLSKLLSEYSNQLTRASCINLLQGSYAIKKSKFFQYHKLWKASAYLLSIWVALLFLYPSISYLILARQNDATENAIYKIYKKHFSDASKMVAPKSRMEEKLHKLSLGTGNQLFLFLGVIGKGLIAYPSIDLTRLDFQNSQMTLEVKAETSQNVSAFTDFLVQKGLSVKQQNANLSGAGINATLIVE